MAFLPYSRTPIVLRVADRLLGDEARLGQQVRFLALTHTQDAAGVSMATILVQLSLHSLNGEALGEELTGAGFSSRKVLLEARNNTLVNAATGQVLAVRQQVLDEAWQAQIDELSQDQDTLLQGDFFEGLRDHGLPGTIRQMIESYIQQADAAGKFA